MARELMAIHALHKLRRGDCWCEMSINNPMVQTHSEACEMARCAVERPDAQPGCDQWHPRGPVMFRVDPVSGRASLSWFPFKMSIAPESIGTQSMGKSGGFEARLIFPSEDGEVSYRIVQWDNDTCCFRCERIDKERG